MSESKSNDKTTKSLPEGRAPNLPERAKEKIESILHPHKSSCHHKRESHGLDDSIDANSSADDVRAPNVFERAKEEFQALAHVLHHKKEGPTSDIRDGNQMAEARHKQEIPSSPSEGTAPNLPERAKEKIEAILHPHKSSSHHKRETHGLDDSIDDNTSVDDVRAPNVFERAKEEFQALAQVLHHKKEDPTSDIRYQNQKAESRHKQEIPSSPSETKAKAENIFVKAKEEIKAIAHHDKSKRHHHKETHGRSDDIDESTPTSEVKGPNAFERVKEEFEAVFEAIHHKKES